MFVKILTVIVVSILILFGIVRYLDSVSVFHPNKEVLYYPDSLGMLYEENFLTTADNVKIQTWLTKKEGAKATLIHFHGNGGNLSSRIGSMRFFYDLGVNVMLVSYRGYGKSEGSPSEAGVYLDALATYDYIKNRDDLKGTKIVVYGESLGGAPASELASKRPVDGIIIDSSFSSARDVAKHLYPFLPSFFMKTKMYNSRKIANLDIPKIIIHSPVDEIIPFYLGKRIYDEAQEPKKMVIINGGHNDPRSDESSQKIAGAFIELLQSL